MAIVQPLINVYDLLLKILTESYDVTYLGLGPVLSLYLYTI